MRTRRRKSLAFTLSAIAHGIPLVWGLLTFSSDLDLGEIEFEFAEVEMIDPDTLQGQKPEPEPEPEASYPPPGAEPPPEGEGEGPEEQEEEKPPEKKFGDERSKVDALGPTTATLSAFMVNKRIRKLPYATQGIEVIAPLPDFQFLIQGGGFDTLHDFDYIVIATSNPRDITQTFLAVEHRLSPAEIRSGVERAVAADGEVINWEEKDGLVMGNPRPLDTQRPDRDPRWFVFLDDTRAVYLREEFLPSVLAGPSDDNRKTSGNFVANLTRMRRFAAREPKAAFSMVAKDLRAQLARAKFPCAVPNDFELMAEAARKPELVARGTFLDEKEAESCRVFWVDKLGPLIKSDWKLKMMVGWIYNMTEVTVDGTNLVLRARFSQDQAEEILKAVAALSQGMLGRSKEEMEAARQAREEAWEKRNGGKLPPSAAFEVEEEDAPARGAAPADGEPSEKSGEPSPVTPPTDDGPDKAPAPDTPAPPGPATPGQPEDSSPDPPSP